VTKVFSITKMFVRNSISTIQFSWGEKEARPAAGLSRKASKFSTVPPSFSLSPREKAGVRGNVA